MALKSRNTLISLQYYKPIIILYVLLQCPPALVDYTQHRTYCTEKTTEIEFRVFSFKLKLLVECNTKSNLALYSVVSKHSSNNGGPSRMQQQSYGCRRRWQMTGLGRGHLS